MKIAASILNAQNKIECIKKLNETTVDYIHIDTMDGQFVPNKTLPIDEVNELGTITKKPFDIHLMVENPIPYINKLTVSNVNCITVHIEIKEDIDKIITLIKKRNCLVGLAINPNTNISSLNSYLDKIDKIIVMSVNPGYGGQKFINTITKKIKNIRKLTKNIIIEVDGGINNKTIKNINNTADIAVVGSYIINYDNYQEAINSLQ